MVLTALQPKLPDELFRYICLDVARTSREDAVRMSRVAWRAHRWVNPLIYFSLAYKFDFEGNIPFASIKKYGRHVMKLKFFTSGLRVSDLALLLEYCPNVKDLSVGRFGEEPEIVRLKFSFFLDNSSLLRFSGYAVPLFGQNFYERKAFQTVTHWTDGGAPNDWDRLASLAKLPNLTHVLLDPCMSTNIGIGFLKSAPRLKVLVWWFDSWHMGQAAEIQRIWDEDPGDSRVVCVDDEYEEDEGTYLRDDIWWIEGDKRVLKLICPDTLASTEEALHCLARAIT